MGQEPGHGVAVLLVVEGDALDDAFQRVERRASLGNDRQRVSSLERAHALVYPTGSLTTGVRPGVA